MTTENIIIHYASGKSETVPLSAVELRENKGSGTLSNRYLLSINTSEGKRNFFMKTFHGASFCPAASSRDIINNEISVEEYTSHHLKRDIYVGYAEIADTVCILFRDILSGTDGKSLADRLNIQESFEYPSAVQIKQELYAKTKLSLAESVHIAMEVATQLDELHTVETEEHSGIIHMDISPHNILIYTTKEQQKVEQHVKIVDLGIARENGITLDKLFNKTQAKGIGKDDQTGLQSYYSSTKTVLHNQIYGCSVEDRTVAEPFLDIYSLSNVLCLMLTGKLVEGFEQIVTEADQEPKRFEDQGRKDFEVITKAEWDGCDDNGNDYLRSETRTSVEKKICIALLNRYKDDAKIDTYIALAGVIQKGTIAKEPYTTVRELYDTLAALGIAKPSWSIPKPTLYEPIPSVIKKYGEVLTSEFIPPFSEINGDALGRLCKEVSEKTHVQHLPKIPIIPELSLLEQLIREQKELTEKEKKPKNSWFKKLLFLTLPLTVSAGVGIYYYSDEICELARGAIETVKEVQKDSSSDEEQKDTVTKEQLKDDQSPTHQLTKEQLQRNTSPIDLKKIKEEKIKK